MVSAAEPAPVRLDSIAENIRLTAGRSSGFDYLRLVLSISVVLLHSFPFSSGDAGSLDFIVPSLRPLCHLILPMFFGLSGFLVAGSLERSRTLISFFGLRVLRIVPALSIEITLSALILGPLFTNFTLHDYVADPQFRTYFLNIVGDIHFTLPGLFLHNPMPATVNWQLWTIPSELQCYAILGALAATGMMPRRILLLVVVIAGQAIWIWAGLHRPTTMLAFHNVASLSVLCLCFLTGVTFYVWRDRVPLRLSLFLAAVAVGIVLGFVPWGQLYLPLPAVYITLYLGFLDPPKLWIVRSGDYSYGIYLYGAPIQQVVAMVPELRKWYWNLMIALPAVIALAYLSWHHVEKPVTKWRSVLPKIEAWLSARFLGGADAIGNIVVEHGTRPSLRWALYLLLGIMPVALVLDAHGRAGNLLALVAFAVAAFDLAYGATIGGRGVRRSAREAEAGIEAVKGQATL